MPVEVKKSYPLENGLPGNEDTPKQIEEFKKDFGGYPVKIVVNPKHRVTLTEYTILALMKMPASIVPLSDKKDIDAPKMQEYHVPIEYSEEVDEHTLLCIGVQPLIDS